MITLNAQIKLIQDGIINGATSNLSGNNISSKIPENEKSQIKNPFIIGSSKIGSGGAFSNGVEYFIGNQLSNEELKFPQSYTIEVSGASINSLTIVFDDVNMRYPNTISVDGTTYYLDDPIFTVFGLQGTSDATFMVKIDNWNTANSPLVISGIYVTYTIDINRHNMISIDAPLLTRGDIKLPSYGIFSNSGKIEFKDYDGEIADYAEQLILTADKIVDISIVNTLNKSEQKVAEFYTKDWDYDSITRQVSVSLKDDLEEWQDINIEGFNYDPRNPFAVLENGSMKDLYIWLRRKTPQKYKMLYFDRLDDDTKSVLTNTKIKYPYLKSGSLWQQWQKLCAVCASYIYKDNEGNTVFRYFNGG